ncbi:MAG: chromate transporter [Clostridia bacterium]|nr:chromate transporter [Clostridia bacterium]
MKAYLELFLTFAKIGAFMFGGGYAMLPLLERELIEKKGWTTQEDILNYFAIAQCTPGVIAVNTATFVGHKQKGVVGGIVATVGVIFVPMIIILTIALALQAFWGHPLVARIFSGIRIAVAALIVSAVIKLFKSSVKNWFGIVLCLLAFCAIAFLDVSPVVVVILAALSGLVYGRVQA